MRPAVAGAIAVIAGFATTAIASTVADAVMHATAVFPDSSATMSDAQFALASSYRAAFTVAGGFVAGTLAPNRPMRHAAILAGIGLVAGIASVIAYYAFGDAKLGPAWYALSIPAQAIPCVMVGGWLAQRRWQARRR